MCFTYRVNSDLTGNGRQLSNHDSQWHIVPATKVLKIGPDIAVRGFGSIDPNGDDEGSIA